MAEAEPTSEPFVLVVTLEIDPERIDEFLIAMKEDAEGSRTEAGCLRFDVLRDRDTPNKFVFYEVKDNE
jgi:quinol monooxygenase YgiN